MVFLAKGFHRKFKFFFFLWIAFHLTSCGKDNDSQPSSSGNPVDYSDPLFSYQWHLSNKGQLGGTIGEDINLGNTWSDGNKGEGILISIIDDGLETQHPDLKENFSEYASYNFTTGSRNPSGTQAVHGTHVAGVIAARDLNGLGVKGVAPRSLVGGINLLASGNTTDANIQEALVYNISLVNVVNNSWGYVDGTGHFYPALTSWRTAIETGLNTGRSGKGAVYIWAAGNGGNSGPDMSNYDGLNNFYGMISVCAVGDDGAKAYYSEKGANLWICAPSLGSSGRGVTTTDMIGGTYGTNVSSSLADYTDKDYTKKFNGTSAAAPIVSGVVALMLKANPNLGWRDVKLILAKSARKNNPTDSSWGTNGAGIPINENFGFGVVNADKAISLSKTWENVGTLKVKTYSSSSSGNSTIGTLSDGITLSNTLSVSESGISKIEYVEITIVIDHQDWGELDIQLKREGTYTTTSQLSAHHNCYHSTTKAQEKCEIQGTPKNQWTFGSTRYLDEAVDGNWKLMVSEKSGGVTGGTWGSWSLKFYGR